MSAPAPWEMLAPRYERLDEIIEQAVLAIELHDRERALLLAAEAVRLCGVLDAKLGHVGEDLGGRTTPLRLDPPTAAPPRRGSARSGSGPSRPPSSGPTRVRPEVPRRPRGPVAEADRWWDR